MSLPRWERINRDHYLYDGFLGAWDLELEPITSVEPVIASQGSHPCKAEVDEHQRSLTVCDLPKGYYEYRRKQQRNGRTST